MKVQQEALGVDLSAVLHRGTDPHVDHRHAALLPEAGPGGVHPKGGGHDPGGEGQVHRGKAQSGPQALAVGHLSAQAVGVAQEPAGPFHLSLGQQGADIRGGDGKPVQLHLGDDVTADAQPGALLPQAHRVALPPVAEVEVVPRHQVDRAVLPDQEVLDKRLPGHLHHAAVKVGDDDLPDAVQAAHQLRPVGGRGDEGDVRPAQDHILRVLVKGHRRRDGLQLSGHLRHPPEQSGVAQMDPVEEAQGDNTLFLIHSFPSPPSYHPPQLAGAAGQNGLLSWTWSRLMTASLTRK